MRTTWNYQTEQTPAEARQTAAILRAESAEDVHPETCACAECAVADARLIHIGRRTALRLRLLAMTREVERERAEREAQP